MELSGEATQWAADALRANFEPMKNSGIFMAMWTGNFKDDALACLQFGAAMMLDKPILIVAQKGQQIPKNVLKVAVAVEYVDFAHPESHSEAIARLIATAKNNGTLG